MRTAHGFPRAAIGILCGVAVIGLFSSFTLVSRLGFSSALTVADLAALRVGVAGSLLLPVVLRHGLAGVSWPQALALAFLGGLGFALLALGGFRLAPAAHGAVLLHGTLPVFTFALLVVMAQPGCGRALGLAAIGLGVGLMAWDSVTDANMSQLLGDLLLLLAALCWSGYGIAVRRVGIAPVRAAAIVAVVSMAAYLPIYALLPGKALFAAPIADVLLQSLFQGALIGAGSIFVYTQAVATLGPARTSLFTAAVPGVTTLTAIPLLGEYPTPRAALGIAVATIGMIVALRSTPAGRGELARMSDRELVDLGLPDRPVSSAISQSYWRDWDESWTRSRSMGPWS